MEKPRTMSSSALSFGKISLRPLEPEDLSLLYKWENNTSIWQVSNTLAPFSRYILKQYIEESHRDIYETKQLRLIIQNEKLEPVGAIDLFDFDPFHQRAGIGILIYANEDRKKGYATDTLHLMCNYAKETLGLYQVYANVAANNPVSVGLFEKCGFHLSGIKQGWLKIKSERIDEFLYQKIL